MKPNFTTCCILICIFSNLSFANYTGTPKTPNLVEGCYSIGSAEELYGFAEIINKGDKNAVNGCVKLTEDIIVNNNVLKESKLNENKNLIPWIPINVFYGTFDGQNHSISGLYLVRTGALNEAGFFLNLTGLSESKPAVVKNLKIKDSYFEGEACVGAIAGQARDVQIENSATEAAIIAKKNIAGGFIGLAVQSLSIKNSYNTNTIKTSYRGGGLIGLYHSGIAEILNSYNVGDATDAGIIGGAGGSSISTIINIKNVFSILNKPFIKDTLSNTEIYITNSFFLNNLSSNQTKTQAEFENGSVAQILHYGKNGEIWGQKIGEDKHPVLSGSIEGFSDSLKISNVKFHTFEGDTTTFQEKYVEGFETLLPTPKHPNKNFIDWYKTSLFTGEPVKSISKTDTGDLNFYAKWYSYPEPKDGCYELASVNDLIFFASIVNGTSKFPQNIGACGKLIADIKWNEDSTPRARTWQPLETFNGILDGQGHKISHLYIHSEGPLDHPIGFCRYTDSSQTPTIFKNIGFEDVIIETKRAAAAFVGTSEGEVIFENAYVTGKIFSDVDLSSAFIANASKSTITIKNSFFVRTTKPNYTDCGFIIKLEKDGVLSIINSFDYESKGEFICNNEGSIDIQNSFILTSDRTQDLGIEVDSVEFADGTIAKALHDYNENGIDGSIWGQSIGKDLYPVHTGKIDTVTITFSSSSKATSSSSTANSSSSKGKSSSGKTSIPSKHSVENANITTRGTTIFVEQYTGLVTVFDLNGNLVRDTYSNSHAEIRLQRAGTYIVRIGAKTRRISLTSGH